MNVFRRYSRASEPGQVLIIVGAGMLVLLSFVALVIDGGHAWAQQRDTQNGNDAAAEAGTIALSQNQEATFAGDPLPNDDAEVLARVTATAGQNNVVVDDAHYTDFFGNRLPGPIEVGSLGVDADPPPAALGVEVQARKDFDTFIAGIMGFDSLRAVTTATARTGPLADVPPGTVLPVTFPVTITGCDGSNKVLADPDGDRWELNVPYVVPLCAGDPGNVGWLDWTPTAGGMSEVIDSVNVSDNPALDIPEWHYVTSTGNQSTAGLQAAIAQYAVPPAPMVDAPPGTVVQIPLFDSTCADDPVGSGGDRPCNWGPGTGSNMWYHFYDWTGFEIDWVDLNGGSGLCNISALVPGATGNGSTGCFKGIFRKYNGPGVLEAPDGTETEYTPWGVELVK